MEQNELKSFIVEALLEGVMDAETTQISRQIVNWIKTNPKKRLDFIFNNKFNIVVNPYQHSTKLAIINGLFDSTIGRMEINILIPSELNKQKLSEFIPRLKEIIRHELEHAQQNERLKKNAKQIFYSIERDAGYSSSYDRDTFSSINSARNYFLGPKETEAFVAGLYKQAKMTKEPLIVLIDKRIEEIKTILKLNFLDKYEINQLAQEIKYSWTEYALARYPNVNPRPLGLF